MRLGDLEPANPFLLAPMAGYTDQAFRKICRGLGAALVYTEVVSADGLHYGGRKTFHLLQADPSERPLGVQIFGADDDRLVEAARRVERLERFDLLDLNMGCPVRKIVRKGAGAAMLRDPERIAVSVRRVVESVDLPVTVKMRSGWERDDEAGLEAARAAASAGAAAVTMHARPWRRKHRGEADWEILRRLAGELPVPLIGNGGVRTAADAVRMLEETGVQAVMIARGAIGYPWIFRESVDRWRGREPVPPTLEEIRETMLRQIDLTCRMFEERERPDPEKNAAIHFRKHAIAYFKRLPGYREFAPRVRKMVDRESARREVIEQIDRVARTKNPA